MFKLFIKKEGFSLVELLTVLAIVVTLAGVGISSFNKSVNRSRMVEAKNSLSFVYTSQTKFHNEWETYHENLLIVGAIPQSLNLNYDVGFKVNASDMSKTDGTIEDYPEVNFLPKTECSNWYQICSGSCNFPGITASYYFRCSVVGTARISRDGGSYKADDSAFKAGAISNKVKSNSGGLDEWSIDKDGVLKHP